MKIEVSIGEILDKHSILQIKLDEIKDNDKLINIQKEYDLLKEVIQDVTYKFAYNHEFEKYEKIKDLYNSLLEVNRKLWIIEDRLRDKERISDFDPEFIELARQVYITNDLRSKIKKEINLLTGSDIIEEKSYKKY